MTSRGDDTQAGTDSTLQCLECGAILPPDSTGCDQCGNKNLLLPERWTPPDRSRLLLISAGQLGRETKVLVGLSLALFCALALLGATKMQTNSMLKGEQEHEMQIVVRSELIEGPVPEVEVLPEEPEHVEEIDIESLRASALEAEEAGAWFDAADHWKAVTKQPDATLDDFLLLAEATERSGDLNGARTALNLACVRFPDSPGGYAALGALEERSENPSAARFQYQVGLSYCPDDPGLREGLGRCDEALGISAEDAQVDWRELQEIIEGAVEESSEQPPIEDEPKLTQPPPSDEEESEQVESQVAEPVEEQEELTVDEVPPVVEEEPEAPPDEPVTLIGSEPVDGETESDVAEEGEQVAEEATEEEKQPVIGVTDFRVEATEDSVIVELRTDRPAELISSSAGDPPRLILRLPNARIAEGADIPPRVTLNTPLVESVNLSESSADSMFVTLVIYLGPDARYTISSGPNAIRVNIGMVAGS